MEYKTLKMTEFKTLDEPGTFRGQAAVLTNKDLGKDVIEPGAFKKTLRDKGGKFPFLDNHDSWSGTGKRLGIVNLEEGEKSLDVTLGKLNLEKKESQDAYSDMKFFQEENLPLGMSIGYDAVKVDWITEKDGSVTRHLKEVALWEVSLVTFPMNPKARVRGVKGLGLDFKQLLDDIKSGRLTAEELKELKSEFVELKALLDGEAASKDSDPAAKAQGSETTIDLDFWRQIKNERRTK